MTLSGTIFWFVVLVTVGSALFAVVARSMLHATLSLCATLLGIAAVYLFLHAELAAAIQVLVQAGGAVLLILFAVMFSSKMQGEWWERGRKPAAIVGGGAIALLLFFVLSATIHALSGPLLEASGGAEAIRAPEVRDVGRMLLGKYMIPLEAAAVAILAALIGSMVLLKKEAR